MRLERRLDELWIGDPPAEPGEDADMPALDEAEASGPPCDLGELPGQEIAPLLAGTLASYNLPLAGITLILGVDELMDMARTMTNVIGNCLASVVVAKWEGEFRPISDLRSQVAD